MVRIADIMRIFGISCGYNEGLTPKGAARWLSKIPLNKQKEIYYYTTSARVSYYNGNHSSRIVGNFCESNFSVCGVQTISWFIFS